MHPGCMRTACVQHGKEISSVVAAQLFPGPAARISSACSFPFLASSPLTNCLVTFLFASPVSNWTRTNFSLEGLFAWGPLSRTHISQLLQLLSLEGPFTYLVTSLEGLFTALFPSLSSNLHLPTSLSRACSPPASSRSNAAAPLSPPQMSVGPGGADRSPCVRLETLPWTGLENSDGDGY